MNYTWASATDSGHVRDHNEDSLAPTEDGSGSGPLVVAIADGMGGHAAGEVASRLAIDAAVIDAADDLAAAPRVTLGNQAVVDATHADDKLAGMGTTLTLAILGTDGVMHIAHVGDSRLYLFRDDELRLLTNDHTWVGELVARGQLTPAEAANHPRRHFLTRVLGMDHLTIDETKLDLVKHDRILVCSDGLTTMLEDARIATHLRHEETVTGAAWALLEAANAAGGYDNTSVVVIDVGP
jgi:protein phosphatase